MAGTSEDVPEGMEIQKSRCQRGQNGIAGNGVAWLYPLPASVCVGGEENVICDRIFSGCPGWNYWRDHDCAGVQ